MGWQVIALGSIDLRKTASLAQIFSLHKKLDALEQVVKCEIHVGYLNIEMSGNKGINYEPVTDILKAYYEIIDGEVNLSEYSETGEGLYFDPASDREQEEE